MEEFIDKSPIDERTPTTEAKKILSGLAEIHVEAFGNGTDFYKICVEPMWSDDVFGDDLVGRVHSDPELVGWVENPVFSGEREARTLVALMRTACAYAIQSMKAPEMSSSAWAYACKASEWMGMSFGFFSHCGRHVGNKRLSQKGGIAKNANKNKLKEWVLNEYKEGSWKTRRDASFKLVDRTIKKAPDFKESVSAQEIQRTIYKWILALPTEK